MKALALWLSIAAAAAVIGCRREPLAAVPRPAAVEAPTDVAAEPSPHAAAPPAAENSPRPEHEVAGHHIRLIRQGKMCVLVDRVQRGAPSDAPVQIPLALEWPCYLLLWNAAPPARAGKPSDGISVGGAGEPLAWRYPSVRGATIVAVIGDAISAASRTDPIVAKRLAQGLRCAPSLQGVLLAARNSSKATRKRGDFGTICVEGGVDEKVLWMLAHD